MTWVEREGDLGDPRRQRVVVDQLFVFEALLPDLAELDPFEQVLLADDAEGGGLGRGAGRLHGPQQPLELVPIGSTIFDEILQACPGEPQLGDDGLALAGAAQTPEVRDHVAHEPDPANLAIGVEQRTEQAGEPLQVIPCRNQRIGRPPALPAHVGRFPHTAMGFADPGVDPQVGIEQGVALDHREDIGKGGGEGWIPPW